MTGYQIALYLAGAFHVGFMLGEMLPWAHPYVLRKVVSKKLPGTTFTPAQTKLVADIVKNAGIYNGIVAASLLWAAYTGEREVARVLLTGVTVAGIVGGVTLSPVAWAQAALGLAGIFAFYFS